MFLQSVVNSSAATTNGSNCMADWDVDDDDDGGGGNSNQPNPNEECATAAVGVLFCSSKTENTL